MEEKFYFVPIAVKILYLKNNNFFCVCIKWYLSNLIILFVREIEFLQCKSFNDYSFVEKNMLKNMVIADMVFFILIFIGFYKEIALSLLVQKHVFSKDRSFVSCLRH